MARRDYKREYARRQANARSRGFKTYAQERTARREFSADPEIRRRFYRSLEGVTDDLDPDVPWRNQPVFGAWWRAHFDARESQRRDKDSARAYWYVEVTGQVASYDQWVERYGG